MTREEAINRLKNTAWIGTNKDREETEQAVELAIEALSAEVVHIETYRELYEKYVEMKHASADRPRGEWQRVDEQPYFRKHYHKVCCSVCHKHGNEKYNYCPNCGADMRGGTE